MQDTEKYIARLMFQIKVHASEGNTFEALFTAVMGYHNTNFSPVKPQGPIGDRKNDGFDQTTGVYYQVYAPEDPSNSISDAIKKLKTDFEGLKNYWDSICKIREYHFVFNDKYKGPYPTLFPELQAIQNGHSLVASKPFLAKELEHILFQLAPDQIFMVIGPIPKVEDLRHVQIASIGGVIQYLLNNKKSYSLQQVLSAPDFQEKIEFNGLSDTRVAPLLHTASFQNSVVDDYFSAQSLGMKQDVRNIFRKLYEEGVEKFKDETSENKSDLIFFYILEHAYDNKTADIQQAILVLMAYYFESCDIFEEPKGKI